MVNKEKLNDKEGNLRTLLALGMFDFYFLSEEVPLSHGFVSFGSIWLNEGCIAQKYNSRKVLDQFGS